MTEKKTLGFIRSICLVVTIVLLLYVLSIGPAYALVEIMGDESFYADSILDSIYAPLIPVIFYNDKTAEYYDSYHALFCPYH